MTGRSVRLVGCIALLFIASLEVATAAERGFYAGIAYDRVDSPLTRAPFDEIAVAFMESRTFIPQASDSSFKLRENGYSVVIGYRLFEYLALEGGYMDLGKATYRFQATGAQFGMPANATVNLEASTSGFEFSALGILPLSYRWEVFGRLGAMYTDNQLSIFVRDLIASASDRGSQHTTNLVAGVGVGYTLVDTYTLRAEYQRVFGVDAALLGVKEDVDKVSLGVTVRF